MRPTLLTLLALLPAIPASAQPPWPDYQIIEWQHRTPAALDTLKSLGVTAGMTFPGAGDTYNPSDPIPAGLRAKGLRPYIENIATDFYAAYHRYTPGKRPGWRFAALQARYAANPDDLSVFRRSPSLSDPAWLQRIETRLTAVARAAAADHPLYESLGDETGIADLAAPWDFDLSPEALAAFRRWLPTQYPSLTALNAEWGTAYTDWDQAAPELTTDAIRRTDDNFARWSDFKAWMDTAFADALRAGTDAVHRGDPAARAAIEGAQVPGWGGYDYTQLSHAVDVMEIYDSLENLAILHALNPQVVPLTTSFGTAPAQLHAIWRAWLRGSRGLILWDPKGRIVGPDGAKGADAAAYAPIFAALRGPLGHAVLGAAPVRDPVAILYSPASFRVQWLLEQRPQPRAWVTRSLDEDDRGDAQSIALARFAASLRQLGLTPTYVGPDQLARGDLHGAHALVLPHAIALSPAEAAAIARFAAAGGAVIADTQPGTFDAHGKRRSSPPLTGVHPVRPDDPAALTPLLAAAGIQAPFKPTSPAPDVVIYRFADGSRTILALQRDPVGAGPEPVAVTLPRVMEVTDLRTGARLGQVGRLSVTLDPIAPAVFAIEPGAAAR